MPPTKRSRSVKGAGPGQARQLTEVVTRLRRALRASVRDEYSWESLPMAQVELLQVLADKSPMRVRDIAAERHLAPSTVSSLISQLMAGELVERAVDPKDRRVAAVSLRSAGRKQLHAWLAANERHINRALQQLPADQRRLVEDAIPALGALADLLEEPEPTG